MGRLELGEPLQIFVVPVKALRRNQLGERKGGLFRFDENFVSTSWRDSWGPLLPRLASPRLASSSPARGTRRREGFAEPCVEESPEFGFLLAPSLGSFLAGSKPQAVVPPWLVLERVVASGVRCADGWPAQGQELPAAGEAELPVPPLSPLAAVGWPQRTPTCSGF